MWQHLTCIKACRRGQEVQFCFQTKCQNGEEIGSKLHFDRGMIVGARQGVLSISETADLVGFSHTTVSRVCREWCKKTKIPSVQ